MGAVDDYLSALDQLRSDRVLWEAPWLDCIKLALPMHADFTPGQADAAAQVLTQGPKAEERGRKLYDSIGVMAVDRLASGMESLVTPQSEYWHGLKALDIFGAEETDEEREYFERYRNYLFTARYAPQAGFSAAHQKAVRSAVALGTGITYNEEAFEDDVSPLRVPFRYCSRPLTKSYLAANRHGVVDTNYFVDHIPARVLIQRHGEDAVSDKVRDAANNPAQQHTRFAVLHAVQPRSDRHRGRIGVANSSFESVYIEIDNKHLIGGRTGGFFEFPFSIYHWQQSESGAYGESALMMALGELKALQIMGKTGLRIHQQMADPPTASYGDGMKTRVNMNPRANNPGMVNADGRLLIQPIHTAQLPNVFNEFLTGRREAVSDMLYIRLFQILVQNPGMTATEALIRNNEKSELLGPAGTKIQTTMAQQVERETAILERRGIYAPGSPLEPPQSLQNREFGPHMTSPLDRLRRSKELIGTNQMLEVAGALVNLGKAEVMDNIDADDILRKAQQITGAPASSLKRAEEVEQARAARQQAMAEAQKTEALRADGEAATAAAEGMDASAALGAKMGPALQMQAAQQARSAPPRGA